jgi:hypothetical protein
MLLLSLRSRDLRDSLSLFFAQNEWPKLTDMRLAFSYVLVCVEIRTGLTPPPQEHKSDPLPMNSRAWYEEISYRHLVACGLFNYTLIT